MISEGAAVGEGALPCSRRSVGVAEGVEGLGCGDALRRVRLRFCVLDAAVVVGRGGTSSIGDAGRVARGGIIDDGRGLKDSLGGISRH